MMKLKCLSNSVLLALWLGSWLACASLPAQRSTEQSLKLIAVIPGKIKTFTTDKLGQSYLVSVGNEVVKYDPQGKELFRYSNNTLGNLAYIDATNPFSLLLFYPEFATVITLDRTLNKTGEISLFDLDVIDVDAVAMSNDNNIWLYDKAVFQLKKINDKGSIVQQSDDLSLALGQSFDINFMLERANEVYLNDPEKGIFVFDLYGQYIRKYDMKGLLQFQILDSLLIYQQGGILRAFNFQSAATQIIRLPDGVAERDEIRLHPDRLFLAKTDRFEIYQRIIK